MKVKPYSYFARFIGGLRKTKVLVKLELDFPEHNSKRNFN
jgi:hypothetical protein